MNMNTRSSLRFVCLFAALLVCLIPAQGTGAAESKARRWAVIVGVNDYLNEVTPLRCAVNDAVKFRDALIESARFNEKDIFLLTSGEPGNRKPTRANIIKRIAYIKAEARRDDTFIFFFSGHGMDMEKESYLLTYDADPYSKDMLDMTSLKISDLKKILDDMPTEKILLLIDACRNDPRAGKGDVPNLLTMNQSRGLILKPATLPKSPGAHFSLTFFSCQVGQRSYEWSEEKMGFFTYHLVRALKGAGNAQGKVTLGSLKRYLGKEVPEAVKRERGPAVAQNPWVKGDASADADDFVLAWPGSSSMAQPTPAVVVKTPGAVLSAALNLIGNGGFEAGLAWPWGTGRYSELGRGKCWWNSTTCQSTAVVESSERHEGTQSLHIMNPSPQAPHVFGTTAQRVAIKKNTPYRLTLWAKGKKHAARGGASIIVDNRWLVHPIIFPAGDFDWQQFEGTFTLDSDYADLRIISQNRGELWIDDIVLCPAEEARK